MGSRKGGIRNFSMKKLGTPIAAGPGTESEKPGFAEVGVPLGWRMRVPWTCLWCLRTRGWPWPPVSVGWAGCLGFFGCFLVPGCLLVGCLVGWPLLIGCWVG